MISNMQIDKENIMFFLKNKQDCCGCSACLNICPKNAFLYKDKEISQYKPRFKELEKSEQ